MIKVFIPNAPLPLYDPLQPKIGPHSDGVIGFVSYDVMNQFVSPVRKLIVSSQALTSVPSSQQASLQRK